MKFYVRLLGARATKLALSLYEAPDLPEKNLFVGPPILRKQLFELESNPDGDFVLVYLLNHGYAEQIIEWSAKNPQTKLHCFYDKPDAPAEFRHSPSLTFHRLDGEKFLRMMAECRHVVCTAGFESLTKPRGSANRFFWCRWKITLSNRSTPLTRSSLALASPKPVSTSTGWPNCRIVCPWKNSATG